ncbi:MAG: DUF1573 domain-containing protein [Thermoguttaceae bacterium]
MNLGVVTIGESARATFKLTNTSDKALELSLGRPSCGCLSARLGTERVESKASVDLVLVLSEGTQGAGLLRGRVALGIVGCAADPVVFEATALVEGMNTDPYSLRFPANLSGLSPEPIRGEIVLGPDRRGCKVRIVGVNLKHAAEQGGRFIEIGTPVLGDIEDMTSHLRCPFHIPVAIIAGRRPQPSGFDVRIIYQIAERTADHHLRLLVFPDAMVPPAGTFH